MDSSGLPAATLRRTLLRAAVLALAATGAVALPATAGAAEAAVPAGPGSFATVQTVAYGPYGSTFEHRWRAGAGAQSIELAGDVASQVVVKLRDPASYGNVDLTFSAGSGHELQAGTYVAAQSCTGCDGPSVRATDSVEGVGGTMCSGPWGGTFTVHEVTPDLSRLRLSYVLECGLYTEVYGEVRVDEPADPDLLVVGADVAFPETSPGTSSREVAVQLVNTGTTDVAVSGAQLTAGAGDFALEAGACATIPVGGSCAVGVTFTPSAAGPRTGTLTITDSTAAGSHVVRLAGAGAPGHTSWESYAQAEDTADESGRVTLSPGQARFHAGGDAHAVWFEAMDGRRYVYRADFRGDNAHPLLAGTTHTGNFEAHGDGYCDDPTGTFTVREAAYDGAGALTKLAVTFEQHCEGRAAGMYGSLAWRADEAAPSAGGIAGVAPDAVLALKAVAKGDAVDLSWVDVGTPDWAYTVVRGAVGAVAPASKDAGFAVYKGRAGAATKSGLKPGTTYSFAAFSVDNEATPLVSPRKSITVGGSRITLSASKPTIAYGEKVTLRGRAVDLRTGGGIGGVPVNLYAGRPGGDPEYLVGTVKTKADGTYLLAWSPAGTYQYWAEFEGRTTHLGAATGPRKVAVSLWIDVLADRKLAKAGTRFRIAAFVTPPTSGRPISLQQYVGGKWKTIQTKKQSTTKATIFTVTAPAPPGDLKYRVSAPGDGVRSGGKSKTVKIGVYR